MGPMAGFEVTHIRVRRSIGSGAPVPWNSWVAYLANDEQGFQIPIHWAEWRVKNLMAEYFIQTN
jgi:hypothetical protein